MIRRKLQMKMKWQKTPKKHVNKSLYTCHGMLWSKSKKLHCRADIFGYSGSNGTIEIKVYKLQFENGFQQVKAKYTDFVTKSSYLPSIFPVIIQKCRSFYYYQTLCPNRYIETYKNVISISFTHLHELKNTSQRLT